MKKMLMTAAAFTAVAGAMPAKAAPRRADCLIVVDGKTYVNGPCQYDPFDTDGSFTLGDYVITHRGVDAAHTRGRGTFVQIDASNGTATWNEGGAYHAQAELGAVHKAGACWVGARAKVCAWKIGEKRYFTE
jgi:hypothetical protein